MKGHSMSDIDNMSYWDFLNVMEYTNKRNDKASGRSSYSKISKTQKSMIEVRKEKEARRKKKEGKK